MLELIRDKYCAARLRAKYQRLVQERLLTLVERSPRSVEDDPDRWTPLNACGFAPVDPTRRADLRTKARHLVTHNAHARNVLRLLENYVVGPGLRVTHAPRHLEPGRAAPELDALIYTADRIWENFLESNARHFSYREYARRAWRDGECFLRKYISVGTRRGPAAATRLSGESVEEGLASVRFVDPELIAGPPQLSLHDMQGILTDPHDVERPLVYLRTDPTAAELVEEIPADEMFHTKLGVDSNVKRGITIFAPVLDTLTQFDKWLDAELLARRLQASIVLWRRVQGSPSQIASFADAAQGDAGSDPLTGTRRERYRPGSILTTSQGTELQFLQPDTNFGDAVPLGRMLLLCVAAGQGLPEFMLTSDASNGNFASTMVAEGPAVKMFQAEQQFFISEFERIRRWVMEEAIAAGQLPANFFDDVVAHWSAPDLVNRDRPRERMADAVLVDSRVLSRAEVARRDGVDPQVMRAELAVEGGESESVEGEE